MIMNLLIKKIKKIKKLVMKKVQLVKMISMKTFFLFYTVQRSNQLETRDVSSVQGFQ